jgi:hypothetical protein
LFAGSLEPIKKLCIFYGSETLFELLDMMKVSSQEKGDAEFCPEFMIGEWIIACLGVRSTQREVDHCLVERTKSILLRFFLTFFPLLLFFLLLITKKTTGS